MGRRWPRNERRLGWLTNFQPGVAAQFSFISIFNSSNQYFLALLEAVFSFSALFGIGWTIAQGKQGAGDVGPVPFVFGDPGPPAVATIGSVVTRPANSFADFNNLGTFPWMHDYPFIILPPGVSATSYGIAVNSAVGGSVLAELVMPDELANPNIGNKAIDPH